MLSVSDTSPLSNLAKIGYLFLIREQFGSVVVPGAVWAELMRLPAGLARAAIWDGRVAGWIVVRAVLDRGLAGVLRERLDAGEAETIALAVELGAGSVLMDERLGRRRALEFGLTVQGVLGILLRAKRDGRVEAVRPLLGDLCRVARFRISAELRGEVLAAAGEGELE